MNRWLFLVIATLSLSCTKIKKEAQLAIDLPFFNDPELTPLWIEKTDPKHAQIHQIEDFEFVNQLGDTLTNQAFEGKIYVANFFFTICPSVCPKMTKNLHRVQKKFGTNDQVRILSHSVMPWADSVGRLNEYAEMNNIKSDFWHLVTGPKEDIYTIARQSYFADEGFGKNVTDINDFLHTEKLILIDRKRRIRGVYNGTLALEVDRMIEDINYLLKMP